MLDSGQHVSVFEPRLSSDVFFCLRRLFTSRIFLSAILTSDQNFALQEVPGMCQYDVTVGITRSEVI